MKKPKISKLPNGLRLLMVPLEEQQTATVLVLVEAGSKYETKKENGLSHFLEHMCFKGTEKRANTELIATELDSIGAEYNAFTGHEYTGYYAKVAKQHVHQALELVADLFVNPTLKSDDIEREKGVIVGEIDMRNDMLPGKASELFMKLLYGDQPAGWPIAGPREQIATFTREDFVRYRTQHYVPSSTIVVVAGKFDPVKVKAEVKEYFGKIPNTQKKGKKKINDKQQTVRVWHEEKASDQTHLVLGVRGVDILHDDIPAFSVLSTVLGGGMSSRLFTKMRGELGLGYYTHASHDAFTDHGIFAVAAGVDNARVEEAVTVICAELTKLVKEPPTEAEMKKVKDMVSGRILLGLESSDEIAEFYGFQEVLKKYLQTPDEALRKIKAVTSADVHRIAKKYLKTERLNMVVLGPRGDTARLEKLLMV